jgi:hypothetical protein
MKEKEGTAGTGLSKLWFYAAIDEACMADTGAQQDRVASAMELKRGYCRSQFDTTLRRANFLPGPVGV